MREQYKTDKRINRKDDVPGQTSRHIDGITVFSMNYFCVVSMDTKRRDRCASLVDSSRTWSDLGFRVHSG